MANAKRIAAVAKSFGEIERQLISKASIERYLLGVN